MKVQLSNSIVDIYPTTQVVCSADPRYINIFDFAKEYEFNIFPSSSEDAEKDFRKICKVIKSFYTKDVKEQETQDKEGN